MSAYSRRGVHALFSGTCSAPAHPFVKTCWCSPARPHIRCGGKQVPTELGMASLSMPIPLTPELPPFVQRPDCDLLSRVENAPITQKSSDQASQIFQLLPWHRARILRILKWPRRPQPVQPL